MTKGRGRIEIATSIWEQIGSPQTLADWRKALLLPDDYEVESVARGRYPSGRTGLFILHVRSEAIPIRDAPMCEADVDPRIRLLYSMKAGYCTLEGIEISRWDGAQWVAVKPPVCPYPKVLQEKLARFGWGEWIPTPGVSDEDKELYLSSSDAAPVVHLYAMPIAEALALSDEELCNRLNDIMDNHQDEAIAAYEQRRMT